MRSIVVTGGSRGLGLAIATRLAAGGDQVIAIARTESAALAEARERLDGALRFHAADLADLAAFPRLARELREAHGSIHGLVNNAGLGTSGILATMADARIAELVHLNVTSPITAPAGLPPMAPPRPRWWASPARWRANSARWASPSTRWRRASSRPI
jgi:3-oxoacyl-[acyl-carrier protein] reductase